MKAQELLKDAIDIHIHIGPDPNRRRRVNAYEAAVQAREAGMRAIFLKSHDYITTPLTYTIQELVPEIEVYGGVTLDFEVGGLNPAVVEVAGKLSSKIVWMPTFSSRHDMQKRNINGKGITILDQNGTILPVVREILAGIKHYGMTLATGHLSTQEIFVLLDEAARVGIERTVITHPLSISFGPTASIDDQKRMVREGVFIEHCFIAAMPTSDRMDPQKIAQAIRTIGPEHCIMSTDFGQIFNPPPVEGMRMFIETMLRYDITEDEIITMVRKNPAKVLGLSEV
ncbi:MAG: hypothetical protein JRG73_15615 [Deltaproteobacteria bacterium]|nr:hypothetical protein [Deltaproteobacteria bacterium]MBW2308353.1 hypothetical protein [Deltaproteobacteria bacterium]